MLMAGAVAGSEVRLEIEQDRIIAEGLNPGAEAVVFAVMHDRRGWSKVIRRVDQILADEDHDGRVELVWDGGVPLRSLCVVIDTQTGEMAMATPPGFNLRRFELDDLVWDGPSAVGAVHRKCRYLETLLVQPGAGGGGGVWGLTAGDGPPHDGDGVANGEIRIDFSSMHPLHGSAEAPQAGNGGVVVIIDALTLEIVADTVGQNALGNASEEVLR